MRTWFGVATAGLLLAGIVSRASGEITAAGPLFRPDAITNGLVAYWKLDETSDGSVPVTRRDSSRNRNDLSDNNTVGSAAEDYWSTGENSADFEAADFQTPNGEYFNIPDGTENGLGLVGSDLTIAAWLKRESGSVDFMLCAKGGYGGNGYSMHYSSGDGYEFNINSTLSAVYGPAGTIPVGKWTHMAVTFNDAKNEVVFSKDGNVVAVVSNTDSIASNTRDFRVGSRSDTVPTSFFDGLMKDLAIWNRPLTSLQIKSLALGVDIADSTYSHSPKDLNDGLVSYWKMNEVYPAGGMRYDSHGSNHLPDRFGNIATKGGFLEGSSAKCAGSHQLYLSHSTQTGLAQDSQEASMSFACWVRFDQLHGHSTGSGIAGKVVSNRDAVGWACGVGGGGELYYHVQRGTITSISTDAGIVTVGTWYHVTFVSDADADKIRIYVDGRVVKEAAHAYGIGDHGGPFVIGANSGGVPGADHLNGRVCEAAFWNRPLTTNEIASLATALPVQSTGVVSYWKMDETAANEVRRDAIGPNHLSPSNGVGSTAGRVRNAADFERANSESLAISSASQSGLKMSPKDGLTIMAWINPRTLAQHSGIIDAGYCVFRANSDSDSNLIRTVIPIHF
ncbi:MAG: LamG domain-containing protein, partial [Chloroflexi bacterium]|nr:LamG domain-containing protein [Chloroflexota bacterium]